MRPPDRARAIFGLVCVLRQGEGCQDGLLDLFSLRLEITKEIRGAGLG